MPTTLQGHPAQALGSSVPLQQLYVTPCLAGEGVLPDVGLNVRASSTTDPLLLRFSLEYPPYDLPEGAPGETPRRLALVRIPGGTSMLIHSVHLASGSGGRVNTFFSHVLTRPVLTAREALATWGSPDWVDQCPSGAGKQLHPLEGLPTGGLLTDEVITAFLAPRLPRGSVAMALCPERMRGERTNRREMLKMVLGGCLLVLEAGPAAQRGRFYLHAEPDLVALLLYAAARILPPILSARMTFTTYEHTRRVLRSYRQAQLVGTWSGEPAVELEDTFYSSRGYCMNTCTGRCSPELQEASRQTVGEWVELAAKGDWQTLDKIYTLLGDTAGAVVSVRQAFQAAQLTDRLVTGRAQAADLFALRGTAEGPALLVQHRDKVRSLLLEADLNDPEVRDQVGALLPESELAELERMIAKALQGGPTTDWQSPWRLLKVALCSNPNRLRETLQRILPPPPFAPDLRFALLRELQELQLSPQQQRQSLQGLLRGCTVEELQQFAASGLPADWFAWAICYALLRNNTQTEAVRHLLGGDDNLIRAFWEQFQHLKDDGQRRGILAPLLSGPAGPGALLLSRSLQNRAALRPETLEWLLEGLKAFAPEWAEFWHRDDHLGHLVEFLIERGKEAGHLWELLCRRLNSSLLAGDPEQRALMMTLVATKDRAVAAMPTGVAQVIACWALLSDHFAKASATPETLRQPIIDACRHLGVDTIEALRGYFQRHLAARAWNADRAEDFAGFFHSFYLPASSYYDQAAQLFGWLDVVNTCDDEIKRTAYQGYYLERWVPEASRQRLLEEARLVGKLSPDAFPTAPLPRIQEPGPASIDQIPVPAARETGSLFQATGVRDDADSTAEASFRRSGGWLLVTLGGGFLAALAFGSGTLPARTWAMLAPFLPLVVGLAEAVAVQACVLADRSVRRDQRLADCSGILAVGAGLSIAAGAVAGGISVLQGIAFDMAKWLSVAVAMGMIAGVVAGVVFPLTLSAPRLRNRIAAGVLARALANVTAAVVVVALARWLLR